MSQRLSTLLAAGLLMAIVLIGSPQTAQVAMDWRGLEAAWKAYKENPVGDNALKISNLLPNNVKITGIRDGYLVINMIFDQLAVLEEAIYSGEPNAVKLGFRLYTISYGPFEVELNKIIGNLICFKTTFFLEELSNQRTLFPDLEPIVGSFINDFPDDPAGLELERKMRIKALEYVEDKALRSLRNECIKILKRL
jgi:hypothetical protein